MTPAEIRALLARRRKPAEVLAVPNVERERAERLITAYARGMRGLEAAGGPTDEAQAHALGVDLMRSRGQRWPLVDGRCGCPACRFAALLAGGPTLVENPQNR